MVGILVRFSLSRTGPMVKAVKVLAALPNKRLKLAAPTTRGSHLFVNDQTLRRSLGASR